MPCKQPSMASRERSLRKCIRALLDRFGYSVMQFCATALSCALSPSPVRRLPYVPSLLPFPDNFRSSDCLSVSSARIAVHHHILVPSVSVLLGCSGQVSWHARHHCLCVFPLSRRPVGRVAGLLCERMTRLLDRDCGLLESCGNRRADIRLLVVDTCWRGIAGLGQTLFGGFEPGFELFELGCFGAEGLLPVSAAVSLLFLLLAFV